MPTAEFRVLINEPNTQELNNSHLEKVKAWCLECHKLTPCKPQFYIEIYKKDKSVKVVGNNAGTNECKLPGTI